MERPKIDVRLYEYMEVLTTRTPESLAEWMDSSKNAFFSRIIRLEEPFLETYDYSAHVAGREIGK